MSPPAQTSILGYPQKPISLPVHTSSPSFNDFLSLEESSLTDASFQPFIRLDLDEVETDPAQIIQPIRCEGECDEDVHFNDCCSDEGVCFSLEGVCPNCVDWSKDERDLASGLERLLTLADLALSPSLASELEISSPDPLPSPVFSHPCPPSSPATYSSFTPFPDLDTGVEKAVPSSCCFNSSDCAYCPSSPSHYGVYTHPTHSRTATLITSFPPTPSFGRLGSPLILSLFPSDPSSLDTTDTPALGLDSDFDSHSIFSSPESHTIATPVGETIDGRTNIRLSSMDGLFEKGAGAGLFGEGLGISLDTENGVQEGGQDEKIDWAALLQESNSFEMDWSTWGVGGSL